jgi:hypothetical protein
MNMFWMVRNELSPYVEKGKVFRESKQVLWHTKVFLAAYREPACGLGSKD